MAQASAAPTRAARPGNPWSGPLVIGLGFALGFGLTQRLQVLDGTPSIDLGHRFDAQPLPGISLESLRMRYGAQNESLRGDPNPPAKTDPADQLPEPLPGAEPDSNGAPDPLAPTESAAPTAPSQPPKAKPQPPSAKPQPRSADDGALDPLPPLDAPAPPVLPEATPAR
ncbi:hypothetical protein [Cyanobium sp. ATX 6F1]|uniref:hypothetical protein n=1 Tax=unclassified Cyanobium TaxID=2627006 RepID=UPI0020CC8E83|nr:hypothetical protein [Cyanobium sp. ATX 6F1]MCP9916387.1 hypothetical protein [Cyanobium sp. ATX 6F1]